MKKFYFSYSFLFTVVALAATTSVVQSAPEKRSVGKEKSTHDDNRTTSMKQPSQERLIVGGEQSAPDDYPYFVEMGGCGGALVAPDVVLFAAHCQNWKDRQISIGAYERATLTYGAQERYCEQWIADPTYDGLTFNNDFALCKLNEPAFIDESKVRLVMNDDSTVPEDGENLIVMGLGTLTEGGAGPQFVHNVTVPTISNQDCNAPTSYDGDITSAMMCAGYPEGEKDSCQGDSGGPIVKRDYQDDGTFIDYHVGVVSWGIGCAKPNLPGVYARTSTATAFIQDTICNDFNSVASFCNNPLPPPTPPPVSCDIELAIQVSTDMYATETAWVLANTNDGQPIISRKYLFKFHTNDHSVCLEKNTCYNWEITDSYGDGMCTTAGCGSYSLTVINNINGWVVGQIVTQGNGQFETEETIGFCIDNDGDISYIDQPPTPEPTQAPKTNPPVSINDCDGNESLRFQLELQTDGYPQETSWTMEEQSSDDGADFFGGNYTNSSTIYTEPSDDSYYCLKDETCYLFTIYDSYGDGLQGYYKGFLNDVEVFQGDNAFATFSNYTKGFCVGDAMFNDCDGNESLQFQLELQTDSYPQETSWTMEEQSSDDGADYFGGDYNVQNRTYTEPSDYSYYCLKDDTCYLFTIYDSYGDGLTVYSGYFKGFLNDVEVFQGGESAFSTDTKVFCVGDATYSPISDCDGNESLRFQLELQTDGYPQETTWTMEEQSSDDGADFFGGNYTGQNTIYTEPSDDSYYCLKDETCYLFTIYDSYGDGLIMDDGLNPPGSFKGFLNDVEVFQGDGNFLFNYTTQFCVGGVTYNDPSDSPTEFPSGVPTTEFPSGVPTTEFPSGVPTESCIDNADFRFKNKKKLTCAKYLRGKPKKVKRKCNKKWKKIKIYDWCPETCGEIAGVGRCDFLED